MRLRGIAREKYAATSVLRLPLRVAPTGNEHIAGRVDLEDGVLVTVTFLNRVRREPPIPLSVQVKLKMINARIELHGFPPDTVAVGPAHRECGVGNATVHIIRP